jgi:hypothetical protein
MVADEYDVPIRAEMAAGLARPRASSANSRFQASNPPAELPHCAACAPPASIARPAAIRALR